MTQALIFVIETVVNLFVLAVLTRFYDKHCAHRFAPMPVIRLSISFSH